MIRILLNSDGSILSTLSGDVGLVSLNTAENSIYVDSITEVDKTDYYDFDLHTFISIGDAPSQHHFFDYSFKQWLDKRTITDIKVQKWNQIKQQRNVLEFGGFSFEGNLYDSDQVSQGRILGAMLAGQPQTWTTADNSTIELSTEQLKSLYTALQIHVAAAHERGRIAREAIQAATTKEEVEAVML